MQTQGSSVARVVLRRALAVGELLVAGFLWFVGILIVTGPRLHHMDLSMLGWLSIFFGLGAAAAAVTAWLGGRRWWVWQAAAAGLPVVTIGGLALWVELF
jgi:hypothetical protein